MLRLLLPLLFLAALTASVSAQETMIREVYDPKTDTHVEVLALFSTPPPGGFFPVRVTIANNQDRDRDVRLDFTSGNQYTSQGHSAKSDFAFRAAAGKTVTYDILVPLAPPGGRYGYGQQLNVELIGSRDNARHSIQSGYDSSQPAVLLSEPLYTRNASALDGEANSRYSRSYGSVNFASKFDPKQLPDDWRAYAGFDSMLLLDSDWTNIPPGARNAILSWVRLGGQLVVYTPGNTRASALGLPEDASAGAIVMKSLDSSLTLDAPGVLDLTGKNAKNPPRQKSLENDYQSMWPLQDQFGERDFQYGLFVVVLVLFGILVGPVNLFVFAKAGRRHKLFITTPLISLGTSVLLVALIIFQDGFGGSGLRIQLMEVRPDNGINAAFIQQEQICRTGVLTSGGFPLDQPSTLNPVAIASTRWSRFTGNHDNRGNFSLQPQDGKFRATGDWFQSRSEHGHALSAVIATRGRIERTDSPDTMLSTFDFPIETLLYLDESGQWHRADKIEPGKRFALTAVAENMALPFINDQRKAFAARHRAQLGRLAERRGCFVALTRSAPGIDTHPGIRWKETRTVITGPIATL